MATIRARRVGGSMLPSRRHARPAAFPKKKGGRKGPPRGFPTKPVLYRAKTRHDAY